MVQMIHVNSSNIYSVGYSPLTCELYVRFVNGSLYKYFGVPKYLFTNFIVAPSKGHFFHTEIRNSFNYARM